VNRIGVRADRRHELRRTGERPFEGRRLRNVTTGLHVSRNSESADDVSDAITSTCGNSSRMLSSSAKRSHSDSSARYFATVAAFIFG
jgi:hypothetical protein